MKGFDLLFTVLQRCAAFLSKLDVILVFFNFPIETADVILVVYNLLLSLFLFYLIAYSRDLGPGMARFRPIWMDKIRVAAVEFTNCNIFFCLSNGTVMFLNFGFLRVEILLNNGVLGETSFPLILCR